MLFNPRDLAIPILAVPMHNARSRMVQSIASARPITLGIPTAHADQNVFSTQTAQEIKAVHATDA